MLARELLADATPHFAPATAVLPALRAAGAPALPELTIFANFDNGMLINRSLKIFVSYLTNL